MKNTQTVLKISFCSNLVTPYICSPELGIIIHF